MGRRVAGRAAVARGVVAAAALASTALLAHAAFATRTLRLQLQASGIDGLLVYRVPAKQARLLAVRVPGAAAGPEAIAARLASEALRGLSVSLEGAEKAEGASFVEKLPLRIAEAGAREASGGALEAALHLRLRDRGPEPGQLLRLAVEAGAPLPIELIAATGLRLELIDGPGAPVAGGLLIHPRPGMPCVVRIVR